MVTLKNEFLYVEIEELGAEIRKVICEGESRMWTGNPEYWGKVAPVMFPMCSSFLNDKYTIDGKEYSMGKHGFAKDQLFVLEKKTPISATFLLRDNEETLKQYPWHFEFRITYTLRSTAIEVSYATKNISQSTMYYSVGSHEAYYCEGGIENYDIIFERKETLYNHMYDVAPQEFLILKDSNVLPLYEKYFDADCVVLKDHKSRFVTLRNRKTGKEVSVEFAGFDYLLLWHVKGAEYICIEPWAGICPAKDATGYDITEKEGIISLEPSEEKTLKHTIYYGN